MDIELSAVDFRIYKQLKDGLVNVISAVEALNPRKQNAKQDDIDSRK